MTNQKADNQMDAMYIVRNGSFDAGSITTTATLNSGSSYLYKYTPWEFWQDRYYPEVIRESYPIYIRERAEDKGKQAFEIIKMLQDKKFINFEKVSEFIDAMDSLIKIL